MQISGIVSTVYGKYDTEMQKCIVTADDAYENLREEFVKENNLIESKKKTKKNFWTVVYYQSDKQWMRNVKLTTEKKVTLANRNIVHFMISFLIHSIYANQ